MGEVIIAPKPEKKPPMVWADGLFRFEVDDDVMPKQLEYIKKVLVIVMEVLDEKAAWNAEAASQCDKIYLGM